MFTLEESALLRRMLRTTAVVAICTVCAIAYLLVRTYAAPAPKPQVTQSQHPAHFVPAHRHRAA